jgi:hypothetical protein
MGTDEGQGRHSVTPLYNEDFHTWARQELQSRLVVLVAQWCNGSLHPLLVHQQL